MVKYFDKIEKLDDFKVYLMKDSYIKSYNKKLTIDFYKKYHKIFECIREINNQFEFKLLKDSCNITDYKNRYYKQIQIINLIKNKYNSNGDLYDFLMDNEYKKIINLLNKINDINSNELIMVLNYYYNLFSIINQFNNKNVLEDILMAIKELNSSLIINNNPNYEIKLPNYWYILPRFHDLDERLYNTTGENGHKEANLIMPYYNALDGKLIDPKIFVEKIKDIEENGVSLYDYMCYVRYGLGGKFSNLLNNSDEVFEVKSHIKNNILATTGSVMARGLLWDYFWNLNKIIPNYNEALDKFKDIILDDFLVRVIGFHKIITRGDNKYITTSNLDYNEEFSEYKEHGWNIDFTKPLHYNSINNRIEEIDDSFVKLKQFHVD